MGVDSSMSRPNILLVITDQQSAESVGYLRRGFLNTPTMDALARGGRVYRQAYVATPLCGPQRTCMFTGHHSHQTGVYSNEELGKVLEEDFPTVGSVFRDGGYDTGYAGKWHVPIPPKDKARHGFEYMENIRNNGADIGLEDKAIEFMGRDRENPFFLTVSFNNPHNICEWSRGARRDELTDAVLDDPPPMEELPPWRENRDPAEDETDAIQIMRQSYHASPLFPVGEFGEKEWREFVWAYYRMIEAVDVKLGKIISFLDESGLREQTAILFVSDHGDCQGAHGFNQKTVFFEESARVPFYINYGERVAPGSTEERPVQTGIDLLPTLCDLAMIDPPENLPGVSVLENDHDREYIVGENRALQGAPVNGIHPKINGRMVRAGKFKYSVYDFGEHRESLFDLENDPGEMRNLSRNPSYHAELERMRGYLSDFAAKTNDHEFPRVVE